jgi:hypothetical protein
VSPDDQTIKQQRAVLMILIATCERALEALQVAENPVDETFVKDLERVISRSKDELRALTDRR